MQIIVVFIVSLDINECAYGLCNSNADCTNTIGSFLCTCKRGYTGNGLSCTSMSEQYLKVITVSHSLDEYNTCISDLSRIKNFMEG